MKWRINTVDSAEEAVDLLPGELDVEEMKSSKLLSLFSQAKIVFALVVTWLVVSVCIFSLGPYTRLSQWSEQTLLFDMRHRYSNEQATAALESFGEPGRQLYSTHLVLDTVFVLLQTAAIVGLVLFGIRKRFGDAPKLVWICLPVLLLGLADLVENGAIAMMLATHPHTSSFIFEMARFFTWTKLTFLFVLPVSLVVGVGLSIWAWQITRRGKE